MLIIGGIFMSVPIRECLNCGHSRYTDVATCPLCGSIQYVLKDGGG